MLHCIDRFMVDTSIVIHSGPTQESFILAIGLGVPLALLLACNYILLIVLIVRHLRRKWLTAKLKKSTSNELDPDSVISNHTSPTPAASEQQVLNDTTSVYTATTEEAIEMNQNVAYSTIDKTDATTSPICTSNTSDNRSHSVTDDNRPPTSSLQTSATDLVYDYVTNSTIRREDMMMSHNAAYNAIDHGNMTTNVPCGHSSPDISQTSENIVMQSNISYATTSSTNA